MAKVEFINAILSGKLGGSVYSRNKGGAYIRAYVKPTNANTQAQINARGSFTSAVTAWHGLTDIQKQAWNAFAITNFKPKYGSPGVTFTGFNAFASLRQTALNMARLQPGDPTIVAPAVTTPTFADFLAPSVAPIAPFSSQITTQTGTVPVTVTLNDVVSYATGVVTFKLGLEAAGGMPLMTAPKFEDFEGGVKVGYALVASTPMNQIQQVPARDEVLVVAVTKPITAMTGWSSANEIELESPRLINYAQSKFTYQADQYVKFTCYAVGQNGMTQKIGSKTIQI